MFHSMDYSKLLICCYTCFHIGVHGVTIIHATISWEVILLYYLIWWPFWDLCKLGNVPLHGFIYNFNMLLYMLAWNYDVKIINFAIYFRFILFNMVAILDFLKIIHFPKLPCFSIFDMLLLRVYGDVYNRNNFCCNFVQVYPLFLLHWLG